MNGARHIIALWALRSSQGRSECRRRRSCGTCRRRGPHGLRRAVPRSWSGGQVDGGTCLAGRSPCRRRCSGDFCRFLENTAQVQSRARFGAVLSHHDRTPEGGGYDPVRSSSLAPRAEATRSGSLRPRRRSLVENHLANRPGGPRRAGRGRAGGDFPGLSRRTQLRGGRPAPRAARRHREESDTERDAQVVCFPGTGGAVRYRLESCHDPGELAPAHRVAQCHRPVGRRRHRHGGRCRGHRQLEPGGLGHVRLQRTGGGGPASVDHHPRAISFRPQGWARPGGSYGRDEDHRQDRRSLRSASGWPRVPDRTVPRLVAGRREALLQRDHPGRVGAEPVGPDTGAHRAAAPGDPRIRQRCHRLHRREGTRDSVESRGGEDVRLHGRRDDRRTAGRHSSGKVPRGPRRGHRPGGRRRRASRHRGDGRAGRGRSSWPSTCPGRCTTRSSKAAPRSR